MTDNDQAPRRIPYDQMEIGLKDSRCLQLTPELVENYARLIDDDNPVHLDDEFAAKSFFRKRVAHGMIGAGLISAVLGTRLPGPGAIYLSQELDFKRPMNLNDAITAWAEVAEKEDKHKKVRLHTWVENQERQVVMDGFALVLVR